MGFPCAALKDPQEHKREAPKFTQERTQSSMWARQTKAESKLFAQPPSQSQDPRNCPFNITPPPLSTGKTSLGPHRRLGLGASSGRPQQGQGGSKSCSNMAGIPRRQCLPGTIVHPLGTYYTPSPRWNLQTPP